MLNSKSFISTRLLIGLTILFVGLFLLKEEFMATGIFGWNPVQTAAKNIATLGNVFGLPEMGISEKIGGGNLGNQTQPYVQTNQYLSPLGGQVQGASTTAPLMQSGYSPMPTGTGGAGGGTPTPPPSDGGGGQDLQSLLDQQYESLFSSLGQQEAGLGESRANQEQIAQNTYQQGANTLGTQYGTSKGDIESGQKKALTDLADALRQQWQQGNVMLGSRGASDSSAAKQYSYALSKVGSKQQGDIMQENSKRLDSLKQTYDTNVQNLELEKNNQLMSIANWYGTAMNQIQGMRGEMQAQKSSEILNMALQQLSNVQGQASQQKSILDEWAANKAQSLPQLTQMLAQNAQNLPAFQGLFSNMDYGGVGGPSMFGFGQQDNQKMNLFGV